MNLKQKLDYHYNAFDKSTIIPDPLQFLHLFTKEEDIETAGFISSVFAYGNVMQIIRTLEKIFNAAGKNPYEYVFNFNGRQSEQIKTIKHRFYTSEDIESFFISYKKILHRAGTLREQFMEGYSPSDINIKNALNHFSKSFLDNSQKLTPGVRFMFPMPEKGSSCKRMNLFLRWMVRKDELDFGIWKDITPDKLIIPVDTHIARICRELKLTSKKNVSWRMAEEITGNLKKYDPKDPVKYDFAICHIGMRKMKF
jgi:uncharacterized protein (TIGR02757 family)